MAVTITLQAYLRDLDVMLNNEQPTEVISHCRYILQHFPQNVQTYRLLGKALLQKGHHEGLQNYFDEAAEVFQRVLSVVPDDLIAHLGLSEVHSHAGNLDRAIWHLERAHEQMPGNADLQAGLRELYAKRSGHEQIPEKIQLTRGALARQYVNAQLHDQALVELRSALDQSPNRLDLQTLLAETLWDSHYAVEAGEVALQILKQLPNCLLANRILARLLLDAGRPTDAQIFLSRLEALDPGEAARVVQPDADTPDTVTLTRLDYTAKAAVELSTETPDWVQDLGDLSDMLPSSGPAPARPEVSRLEAQPPAATTPDWASLPGDSMPDWYSGTPVDFGSPDTSSWNTSSPSDLPWPDEFSAGAAEEPAAPADVPDWFAEMSALPATPAAEEWTEQGDDVDDLFFSFEELSEQEQPDVTADNPPSSGFTDLLQGIEASRTSPDLTEDISGIEPAPPDWITAFDEMPASEPDEKQPSLPSPDEWSWLTESAANEAAPGGTTEEEFNWQDSFGALAAQPEPAAWDAQQDESAEASDTDLFTSADQLLEEDAASWQADLEAMLAPGDTVEAHEAPTAEEGSKSPDDLLDWMGTYESASFQPEGEPVDVVPDLGLPAEDRGVEDLWMPEPTDELFAPSREVPEEPVSAAFESAVWDVPIEDGLADAGESGWSAEEPVLAEDWLTEVGQPGSAAQEFPGMEISEEPLAVADDEWMAVQLGETPATPSAEEDWLSESAPDQPAAALEMLEEQVSASITGDDWLAESGQAEDTFETPVMPQVPMSEEDWLAESTLESLTVPQPQAAEEDWQTDFEQPVNPPQEFPADLELFEEQPERVSQEASSAEEEQSLLAEFEVFESAPLDRVVEEFSPEAEIPFPVEPLAEASQLDDDLLLLFETAEAASPAQPADESAAWNPPQPPADDWLSSFAKPSQVDEESILQSLQQEASVQGTDEWLAAMPEPTVESEAEDVQSSSFESMEESLFGEMPVEAPPESEQPSAQPDEAWLPFEQDTVVDEESSPAWLADMEPIEAPPLEEPDILLAQAYDPSAIVGQTAQYVEDDLDLLEPADQLDWMAVFKGEEVPPEPEAEVAPTEVPVVEEITPDWLTGETPSLELETEQVDLADWGTEEELLEPQIEAPAEAKEEGLPDWLAAIASSEADKLDESLFETGEIETEPVSEQVMEVAQDLFGDVQPPSTEGELFDLFGEMEESEQASSNVADSILFDEELIGAVAEAAVVDEPDSMAAAEDDLFGLFAEVESPVQAPADQADSFLFDEELIDEMTGLAVVEEVAQPDILAHTSEAELEDDEPVSDDFSFEDYVPAWLRHPKEQSAASSMQEDSSAGPEIPGWLRDVVEDDDK